VQRFTETLHRSISLFCAIPDGKPFHTFPGIALVRPGARASATTDHQLALRADGSFEVIAWHNRLTEAESDSVEYSRNNFDAGITFPAFRSLTR